MALLLAAVPAWIDAFVAHYRINGRPRTLTASQCVATLARARKMAGASIEYDPSYFRISFPEGDVLHAWRIIGHFGL